MRVTLSNVIEVMKKAGRFATLRTFPYRPSQRVLIRTPAATFQGSISQVIENPTREDLARYLPISGFSDVDEWWRAARRLHRRDPRYLVVVKLGS